MKRVITYGTFDLLHYGHINLFDGLRPWGITSLSRCLRMNLTGGKSKKKSYFSYDERKAMLEAIRCGSGDPGGELGTKKTDVEKYHVDVFVIGDDWTGAV